MAESDNGNTTKFGVSEHADEADGVYHLNEAILRTMRQPLLVLSEDLRVERANRAFYQTFLVEERETNGHLSMSSETVNGTSRSYVRFLKRFYPQTEPSMTTGSSTNSSKSADG